MGIHTSKRHGITQAEPARKSTASLLPEHKRRKNQENDPEAINDKST
jgi:hypothetical protein